MNKLILATLLISGTMFADCSYHANDAKVTWKAFKTFEKIGVGGAFDRSRLNAEGSSSADALLANSTLTIDTLSVNSGNAGRDATLVASFFKAQNVQAITAKVKSAKEGKALVDITMNGVTKTIPLSYTLNDMKIVGKGFIDLNDFGMLPSLVSINKACYELHAGKTWQDVEIGFEIPLQKNCQ